MGRPLAVRSTMHLILKSSRAKGEFSFARPKHDKNIRRIVDKFAFVYGVRIISFANAWNHLHFQIQLSNRHAYNGFIRAITGAIAMNVTGRNRWTKTAPASGRPAKNVNVSANARLDFADAHPTRVENFRFWDQRPFTRVADTFAAYLNLKDYVRMNRIEADGYSRREAREMVQVEKTFRDSG